MLSLTRKAFVASLVSEPVADLCKGVIVVSICFDRAASPDPAKL